MIEIIFLFFAGIFALILLILFPFYILNKIRKWKHFKYSDCEHLHSEKDFSLFGEE